MNALQDIIINKTKMIKIFILITPLFLTANAKTQSRWNIVNGW